jgi:AraC family transcriptional regulator
MKFAVDQIAERMHTKPVTLLVPTTLPVHYLATGLAELLEIVRCELDNDREAALASLVTASSILKSEIERSSGVDDSKPGALLHWQITRVRAFIDANLDSDIQIKDLCAIVRRSRAYFSRSFKQSFGEPPHAYLIKRRLERACYLMVTTSEPLSEIALSVGFSDQAHLCRRFQRVFGQSPAMWRRCHAIRDVISTAGIGKKDTRSGNAPDLRAV